MSSEDNNVQHLYSALTSILNNSEYILGELGFIQTKKLNITFNCEIPDSNPGPNKDSFNSYPDSKQLEQDDHVCINYIPKENQTDLNIVHIGIPLEFIKYIFSHALKIYMRHNDQCQNLKMNGMGEGHVAVCCKDGHVRDKDGHGGAGYHGMAVKGAGLGLQKKELLDSSTVLIIINPESYSVWNLRKSLILNPQNYTLAFNPLRELQLTTFLLHMHGKKSRIWEYRAYLIQNIYSRHDPVCPLIHSPANEWRLEKDTQVICGITADRFACNYPAWLHRLTHHLSPKTLPFELELVRAFVKSHVSDSSGWNYYQTTVLQTHHLNPNSDSGVLRLEIEFLEGMIHIYRDHEALWITFRYLIHVAATSRHEKLQNTARESLERVVIAAGRQHRFVEMMIAWFQKSRSEALALMPGKCVGERQNENSLEKRKPQGLLWSTSPATAVETVPVATHQELLKLVDYFSEVGLEYFDPTINSVYSKAPNIRDFLPESDQETAFGKQLQDISRREDQFLAFVNEMSIDTKTANEMKTIIEYFKVLHIVKSLFLTKQDVLDLEHQVHGKKAGSKSKCEMIGASRARLNYAIIFDDSWNTKDKVTMADMNNMRNAFLSMKQMNGLYLEECSSLFHK